MKEAVEKIVKALVGDADAVEITEQADGKVVKFGVRVAPDDFGRLIGREGPDDQGAAKHSLLRRAEAG
jgi:predicted RNA-binding protein YlqC (UPF0109 family)